LDARDPNARKRYGGPDGNGAEGAANKYMGLAGAAMSRGAYQNDNTQANGARVNQGDGLGMQRSSAMLAQSAAMGSQPSQAQILGQQMAGQGLDAQLAAAASARGGPLAQASANHQAQMGAAQYSAQAANQMAGMRAGEMAQARDQYGQQAAQYSQAAGNMRGQDLAQANAQAENERFQRGLNQQGQMGYDQMAEGVNKSQLDADVQHEGLQGANWRQQNQTNQHSEDRETGVIGSVVSGAGSLLGSLVSDETAKQGLIPLDQPGGTMKLGGGGLDVMGSLKATSDAATNFARNPGMMMKSDERTKQGVAPLYEPPGKQLHWTDNGAQLMSEGDSAPTGLAKASMMGRSSVSAAKAKPAESAQSHRKMTPDEMSRWADAEIAKIHGNTESALARGPAIKPRGETDMGSALAAMRPYEYEYKPQYQAGEGQMPGEKNVGPMAQDMASNPITGTAVVQRGDGKLAIDLPKATKLNLGAVGYLAAKQKEQDAEIAALKQRGGR